MRFNGCSCEKSGCSSDAMVEAGDLYRDGLGARRNWWMLFPLILTNSKNNLESTHILHIGDDGRGYD